MEWILFMLGGFFIGVGITLAALLLTLRYYESVHLEWVWGRDDKDYT